MPKTTRRILSILMVLVLLMASVPALASSGSSKKPTMSGFKKVSLTNSNGNVVFDYRVNFNPKGREGKICVRYYYKGKLVSAYDELMPDAKGYFFPGGTEGDGEDLFDRYNNPPKAGQKYTVKIWCRTSAGKSNVITKTYKIPKAK